MKYAACLGILGSLILIGASLAEQIGEGVVTFEMDIDVEIEKERPSKVDEIGNTAITSMVNVQNFADVIEREVGAEKREGGPVGASFISLRGTYYKWTQILLDGAPVNLWGVPFLNLIPVTAIQKIEVIKGPAPPQYPGNTVSGVVLLTTKTGDVYPSTNTRLTLGSYDQQVYEFSTGGGDISKNYFFAFNHTHQHGWKPRAMGNMTDVTFKVVLTPDNQSKLTLAGSFLGGKKAGFIARGPNPANTWGVHQKDIFRSAGSITYTRRLDSRSDMVVRVMPSFFSSTPTMMQWDPLQKTAQAMFHMQRYDLLRSEVQYNTWPQPDSIITGGIWYEEDNIRFTNSQPMSLHGNLPPDKWRHYLQQWNGAFAQGTWEPKEDTALTLGLRYDDAWPGGSQLTPFGSWHQNINSTTSVRFAFSRTRRFPNPMELYGEARWIGNPNLKAEHGWNFQIDVDKSLCPQTQTMAGLSLFLMDLEDAIVTDANSQYQNLGRARTYGAELAFQGNLQSGENWWFNYTFLNARDEILDRPLISDHRTASARQSAKAGISLTDKNGVSYSGEAFYYGPRRTDVKAPTEEFYPALNKKVVVPPKIGGYLLLNAKVRKEVKEDLALTLSIQNLLDKDYESLLFYPGPGRWISLRVEQDF